MQTIDQNPGSGNPNSASFSRRDFIVASALSRGRTRRQRTDVGAPPNSAR